MKLTTITTLFSLLPFICSAIPTSPLPSPKPLQKRIYTSSWAASSTQYRSIASNAHDAWTCKGDTSTRQRYITWSRSRDSSGHVVLVQVATCTDTIRCPDQVLATQCPETEEAFVQVVLDGVRSKGIHATVDDVYRKLNSEFPAAFPYATLEEKQQKEGQQQGTTLHTTEEGAVVAAPGPTQEGVESACKKWRVAGNGDSCYGIAKESEVDLVSFYKWNPAVNAGGECLEMWVGYAYCVGA